MDAGRIARQVGLSHGGASPVVHPVERFDEPCLGVLAERSPRREGNGVGQRLGGTGRVSQCVEPQPSELERREPRPGIIPKPPPQPIERGGSVPRATGEPGILRRLE